MGDISTLTIASRSVFTLRFTMKQKCDLRWKFKTKRGSIGFGVQRRKCVQPVLSREEVSAYHIMAEEDTKDKDDANIVAATDAHPVPEIQITNDLDDYDRNYGNVKMKYHAGTKHKADCAVELMEEVDEMGSFVEDQTIHAETVSKVSRVNIIYSNIISKLIPQVQSHQQLQTGVLHCEPGFTYILIFDNSHSIFRSKKLTYGVNIQKFNKEVEPNNNKAEGSI